MALAASKPEVTSRDFLTSRSEGQHRDRRDTSRPDERHQRCCLRLVRQLRSCGRILSKRSTSMWDS